MQGDLAAGQNADGLPVQFIAVAVGAMQDADAPAFLHARQRRQDVSNPGREYEVFAGRFPAIRERNAQPASHHFSRRGGSIMKVHGRVSRQLPSGARHDRGR